MTTKDDVLKELENPTGKTKTTSMKPKVQDALSAATERARLVQKQKLQQIADLKERSESPAGLKIGMHIEEPPDAGLLKHAPKGHATFTTHPTQAEYAISKGLQPVINPDTNAQERVGQDLGWSMPQEIADAELEAISARSTARVKAMDEAFSKKQKAEAKAAGVPITEEVTVSR